MLQSFIINMYNSLFFVLGKSGDVNCADGDNLFNWQDLVNTVKWYWPDFANSGDFDIDRRELIAFLAQTSHETTGGYTNAKCGTELFVHTNSQKCFSECSYDWNGFISSILYLLLSQERPLGGIAWLLKWDAGHLSVRIMEALILVLTHTDSPVHPLRDNTTTEEDLFSYHIITITDCTVCRDLETNILSWTILKFCIPFLESLGTLLFGSGILCKDLNPVAMMS